MKLSREKIDLYRAAKCFSVKDLAEEYGVSRARMHSILGQRDVTPLVPYGQSSGRRGDRDIRNRITLRAGALR